MATKACYTKANMQLSPLFSVQSSSIVQSCPTLRDPMDCSMPVYADQEEASQASHNDDQYEGQYVCQ